MAVYTTRPVPVPTPFQSIQYNGNPYMQEKVWGESVSSAATPLYGPTPSGAVMFSNGALVPRTAVSPTKLSATQQEALINPQPTGSDQGTSTQQGQQSSGGSNAPSPYDTTLKNLGLTGQNVPAASTLTGPELDAARKLAQQYGLSEEGGIELWAKQQQEAADAAYQSQLSSLNTQYDQYRANLENQLSGLGTQRQNALSELGTAQTGLLSQIAKSKESSNLATEQETSRALSTAKDVQRQNRNVLRALGILSSSAAGEVLSKPMVEFDKQRAQLVQANMTRQNELADVEIQKQSEYQNAIKSLEDNYATLVANIQNDLRFSDRQKMDAIQQANAVLQQRMGEIATSAQQWQMTLDQQKQQLALQLAQIQGYNSPTANLSGITSNTLNLSNPTPSQTAAVVPGTSSQSLGGVPELKKYQSLMQTPTISSYLSSLFGR